METWSRTQDNGGNITAMRFLCTNRNVLCDVVSDLQLMNAITDQRRFRVGNWIEEEAKAVGEKMLGSLH
jgi:hypothetical protein